MEIVSVYKGQWVTGWLKSSWTLVDQFEGFQCKANGVDYEETDYEETFPLIAILKYIMILLAIAMAPEYGT